MRTSPTVPTSDHAHSTVALRGLRSFLDRLLDNLALQLWQNRLNEQASLDVIRKTHGRIERLFEREKLQTEHLKPQSRALRGWFSWFCDPNAFQEYLSAARLAQETLASLPSGRIGWRTPLLPHFRSLAHLYRWRVGTEGTRVVLPVAMISLGRPQFEQLARLIAGNRSAWQCVTNAMLSEPYQRHLRRWQSFTEAPEQAKGIAHDLEIIFNRVNRLLFDGGMNRPRLEWSRSLPVRKFAHYEYVDDTVMMSSALDCPDVPDYVLDHLMHHELLHKKHGIQWRGSRCQVHTEAFRREEASFPRYKQANEFLKDFAR